MSSEKARPRTRAELVRPALPLVVVELVTAVLVRAEAVILRRVGRTERRDVLADVRDVGGETGEGLARVFREGREGGELSGLEEVGFVYGQRAGGKSIAELEEARAADRRVPVPRLPRAERDGERVDKVGVRGNVAEAEVALECAREGRLFDSEERVNERAVVDEAVDALGRAVLADGLPMEGYRVSTSSTAHAHTRERTS